MLVVKNLPPNARTTGSIPGSGGSPGGGHGNPLQSYAWRISWTKEPGRLQSIESLLKRLSTEKAPEKD